MVDCSQTGRNKDAGEDGGPGIKRDLLATPNRTHHSALASGSAALKFLLELKRPHGLSVSVRLTKAASSSSRHAGSGVRFERYAARRIADDLQPLSSPGHRSGQPCSGAHSLCFTGQDSVKCARSTDPFCYNRTPTLTPSRRLKFAYATPQQLKIIAPGHLRASGVGSLKRLRVSSSPFPLPPGKVFLLAPSTVPSMPPFPNPILPVAS